MSSRLPEFVDPWRLADRGSHFSGTAELANLSRLHSALLSDEGQVSFRLEFSRDEKRRARISGEVSATLVVECQRCLGALQLEIATDINLAVIEVVQEAERLPEEYDPLLVEDGRVRLLDLVEDELILALPQVPTHESGACTMNYDDTAGSDGSESSPSSETAEENPFAVLARLKSKQDS